MMLFNASVVNSSVVNSQISVILNGCTVKLKS